MQGEIGRSRGLDWLFIAVLNLNFLIYDDKHAEYNSTHSNYMTHVFVCYDAIALSHLEPSGKILVSDNPVGISDWGG